MGGDRTPNLERLKTWLKSHPDVWHTDSFGVSHFWWVQNAIGAMGVVDWQDLQEILVNHQPTFEPELE